MGFRRPATAFKLLPDKRQVKANVCQQSLLITPTPFPFSFGGLGWGARALRRRIEAEIVISGHGPQQLGFVPWRHHFPLFLLPGVSMRASLQYSWRFSAHALRHRILKDMNSACFPLNRRALANSLSCELRHLFGRKVIP